MGLRMKNFSIMGVHWKIQFSGGGFTKKMIYKGDFLKRGLGQFAYLRGGLGRGFWGGVDTLMHIISDMEKNCSKFFSDASNSSDIEKEFIKQTNTLKPFNMNLARLFLKNILYRKKRITVKKKLI